MSFEEERKQFEEDKEEQQEIFEEIHTQIKQELENEVEAQDQLYEELRYKEDEEAQEQKELEQIEEEEEEEEEDLAFKKEIEKPVVTEAPKKKEKEVFARFEVDLWRTKMHREEWGIRKDAQRAQKDRQWTRDMDQVGEIRINGDDYGWLAIREQLWKEEDPIEKRFVMKIFSSSGYWRASIELLQGETYAVSHATKEPCPTYVCIFKHTRNLFRIQRLAHKPRFQGQIYRFSYLDENENFQTFVLDDKRLTLSSDWYVKDIHNKVIAKINGKFANVGGLFVIEIYDKKLAADKTFGMMLMLFSSTLRFQKDTKRSIKKALKKLRITDTEVKLDDSESNLYLNPRKLSI
ncbi:MAG: hypothetical protein ACXABK_03205 [Candidatus Heimdallarchaeaceae archaeon]|jgi:hypothetical protein